MSKSDKNKDLVWPLYSETTYVSDSFPIGSTDTCSVPTVVRESSSLKGTEGVHFGENIPRWRQGLRAGTNVTTLCTGEKLYAKVPVGSGNWINHNYRCNSGSSNGTFTGFNLGFNHKTTDPDSEADTKARSKLLASYINATNTWRGGNFLAEVGETINMVLHPCESIYRATWEFAGRVGKLGKVYRKKKDYAKHLADAWLAFVFGVRPLVQDANDAATALKKLGNGFNNDRRPIKGHGRRETKTVEGVSLGPIAWGGNDHRCVKNVHDVYEVTYDGVISASLENAEFVINQFGVGVFDIIPAVWEAIPWSFFIDYFANVGEVIDSFRLVSAGLSRLQVSVRNVGEVIINAPFRSNDTPGVVSFIHCGAAVARSTSVYRAPLTEVPYPPFHFKFPGMQSMKWLNIAALWVQIGKSRP